MIAVVAFHYPRPEHRGEMIQRVTAAAAVMRQVPGCLEAACWTEAESGAVVTTGRFAAASAWPRALEAIAAARIDFDEDERELRPRAVHWLVAADSPPG